MVLDKLGTAIKETLSKIARSIFIDEKLIEELIKELQRALLHSDVNVQLVFDLSKKIKDRALKEKTPNTITQREHLIKIVYEELVNFLGGEGYKIEIKKKPFKIMLVGLYGAGKSTTTAKIAKFFQKKGHKVCMMQTDVYRPAATKQLEMLGNQNSIPVFTNSKEKNPIKIYQEFENDIKNFDVAVIDTAGRDALSKELIEEIERLNEKIKPDETLLVLSGDIGQTAKQQAEQFSKSCNITGVIITKMEGTAKGGGALTACASTKAPIKFIGVGEKINDIEEFNPTGFVSRLLGMGDLELLLEKTKEAFSEKQVEDLGKKFLKGDFNFLDLYEQLQSMSKMGPLSKVMELIPGMGKFNIPKEMISVQEEKLKKWRFILDSCTKEELENPELLTRTRIERIAKGSGTTSREVRDLLKQYKQSRKVMRLMKGKDPEKLLKKFQGRVKI